MLIRISGLLWEGRLQYCGANLRNYDNTINADEAVNLKPKLTNWDKMGKKIR